MKVLLVDDERELVSALAERLSFRGIRADFAVSGEEALKIARRKAFDVAVLDVKMPRIGGFELKKRLARIQPGLEYIFLTGHGSEEDFKASCSVGCRYLVKPVMIEELVEAINSTKSDPGEP